MTDLETPQNLLSSASTHEATSPALTDTKDVVQPAARTVLPSATGSLPKIADSGRIRFGAGFRLRASK